MSVVGRDEHESGIRNIRALLEAKDILEYIVSIVWLSLVRLLEKFQFNGASPFSAGVGRKPKPYVHTAALCATAFQWFFEFDRECFSRVYDSQICECCDDPSQVQLKRRLAFADDPTPVDLRKKTRNRKSYNFSQAINAH